MNGKVSEIVCDEDSDEDSDVYDVLVLVLVLIAYDLLDLPIHRRGRPFWNSIFHTLKEGDGKYQCIDRSDENPYSKITKQLNLTRIRRCKPSSWGLGLGLTCSGRRNGCLPREHWCATERLGTPIYCDQLGGFTPNTPELCSNYTFWSQHPCPEEYPRCTGSRSGQCSRGKCDDKSDIYHPVNSSECAEDSEKCLKDGVSVCLDLTLRCDMHPQCDEGEDEKDCSDAYVTKGMISQSATYSCQSPHHNDDSITPTVKILATRCDGREECFRGEDEADCDIKWIAYTTLGEYLMEY